MKIISLSELLKLDKISNLTVNCECSLFYQLHCEQMTIKISQPITQVSYRFLALGCFPANLVSDVVCVLFVLRVGSLKG